MPPSRIASLFALAFALAACGNPELGLGSDPSVDETDRAAESSGGHPGLSVIGLLSPHYDCDTIIRAFGNSPIVFGYLEKTFGDDRRCLDRLLDHPSFSEVRVHVFNGPCIRDHRCGSYEVLAGETTDSLTRKLVAGDAALLKKMNAELVRVRDLLAPHLRYGKRYYVSGVLENDLKDSRAAKRVVDMVRTAFGPLGFKVVNSAVSGATNVGEDVHEKHGDRPSLSNPCIADLDGTETDDFAGYANRYRGCAMALGWNSEMNCLAPSDAWVDPRARVHCPTRDSLSSFSRVIQR